jgi:hypothetical protein
MYTLLVGLLAGCGQTPADITFDGEPTATVHTTDPVAVQKATVVDKDKKALATQPKLTWTVTPDSVAKLDGTNVVPVANGDAKVKACVNDKLCKDYAFVVAMPDDIQVSGQDGVEWKVGATAQLTAKVMAGKDEVADQKVTWASDNPAVATVDPTGKVTVVAPGAAVITASSGALSETVNLTVVDAGAAPAAETKTN